MQLYAMIECMRLVSDKAEIVAAGHVEKTIIENYLGPNRTRHELMEFSRRGGMLFLSDFSEACRKDLGARATAVR